MQLQKAFSITAETRMNSIEMVWIAIMVQSLLGGYFWMGSDAFMIHGARRISSAIPGGYHFFGKSSSRLLSSRVSLSENSTDTSITLTNQTSSAISLIEQAKKLREEAALIKQQIKDKEAMKLARETAKVDGWIESLLVNITVDKNTQMLNSVEQVTEILKNERFSQEQVFKMYDRICQTGPPQSRSRCSPIMELLIDAAGKLDGVDPSENPNKRWKKVEISLRQRLFAADWGIEIEKEEESTWL